MRRSGLVAVTLLVAFLMGACGKKTVAPPVVPPPTVVLPAPVVKAPRKPAPPRTSAPAAPVAPAERAPVTLQSSADPLPVRAAVEARIRDTRNMLGQLNSRNLTGVSKADSDRAASMLDLAQKALTRGDLRQAGDLSMRAFSLAKTILNAK